MDFLENLSPTSVWLILAVIFAVVEAITLGITSIWFVFAALLSMVAAMLGASVPLQIVIFFVVSVLLIIFTRPILVEKFQIGTEKTNIDAIIGKEAIVKEEIFNIEGRGQVMINGNIWSARSSDGERIAVGSRVIVESIEGVRVIVIKA